jgi:predicted helicase
MASLDLKPSHKAVKDYYKSLEAFHKLGVTHEMAVRSSFQRLLEHCCKKPGWTLVGEYQYVRQGKANIQIDGAVVDGFKIPQAYWEAKDTQDDLRKEVQKKFEKGYPRNNIIFQSPDRAIVWQDNREILDEDITKPETLVYVVKELFGYQSETQRDWEVAVEEFKPHIPEIAAKVVELIEVERKENKSFVRAFDTFAEVCRSSINPNLADAAVEEMLVQHLLTERIFRKVFHNSEFTDRNIIAHEIERVIHALTSRKFSREEFLKPLDRFYGALEKRAETLDDYSQQQTFLNTVYEKFFQGFAVKQADTHGIVYTPQPIVDFMVRSVEEILKKEFGKSLSDEGVHIIDPFVGTGNFITRIMQEIKKTSLEHKYARELHCNEVMLLPYYIASMNIEHAYYDKTLQYKPFEGICLVDTFELAEDKQYELPLFTEENTERVERLRKTKLFVIIGNPPYNTAQVNENDNNKNRKYKTMDRRVSETYAKDGTASNKNKLSDPYVKAIRWASDRIIDNGEGVIAFVTNNSFVENYAFDGMRKHLSKDFERIYIVDLKGNIRRDSMRDGISLGERNTVFGLSAMVGVSITFLVKTKKHDQHAIYYAETDFRATREEKFHFLEAAGFYNLPCRMLSPNDRNIWLQNGLQEDFGSFLPVGSKDAKAGISQAIFRVFSLGINTNRDSWAYNFEVQKLTDNIKLITDAYNEQAAKWHTLFPKPSIDDFVTNDEARISWSEGLKKSMDRGSILQFQQTNIRVAIYRPFVTSYLYFDPSLTERRYQIPKIFPEPKTELENLAICVNGIGSRKPFSPLMVNRIPDNTLISKTQCFSYYVYDRDGTNRRENITDWGVTQFSSALGEEVDKWQIFHYIYGLLHSPEYREKYQANLKRELPRIPLPKTADQFHAFVSAGERLADLHVNYESQPEYKLEKIETPGKPLDWRVEKMKLTKDKTAIVYNDFLTLAGIPSEVFEYRLGNRSALEWIVDRYQVRTDKRSGIVNDPNRKEDKDYIVRLIGKVITVSLETVKIVKGLPPLPSTG